MTVLGADLDRQIKQDWPEDRQTNVARRETYYLAHYFIYHPNAPLSYPFHQQEWIVVLAAMSRLRRQGYSDKDIRRAVDSFYVQYSGVDHHPAYLFSSNAVMVRLLGQFDFSLETVAPCISFVANGFERSGESLPWDEDDDDDIRKAIIVFGTDVPYRYPIVIADLLMNHAHSISELKEQLQILSDIVSWNTDPMSSVVIEDRLARVGVTLPQELRTKVKSPSRIVAPAPTLKDAVKRYLGSHDVRNSD